MTSPIITILDKSTEKLSIILKDTRNPFNKRLERSIVEVQEMLIELKAILENQEEELSKLASLVAQCF